MLHAVARLELEAQLGQFSTINIGRKLSALWWGDMPGFFCHYLFVQLDLETFGHVSVM